jgi:hypothetical protein
MPGNSFQLTPDVKYLIALGDAPKEGDSAIANTGGDPILNLVPNTEHWSLTPAFMDALQRAKEGMLLTFQGATLEDPPTGFPVLDAYPTFLLPTNVLWTAMTSPPSGELWLGPATGPNTSDRTVGIDFTSLAPPPSSTGSWSGSITWYVSSSSARQPADPVIGAGTTTLSYSTVTSPEAGLIWFSAKLSPEAPPST